MDSSLELTNSLSLDFYINCFICNKLKIFDEEEIFHLTSCFHLFCQNCSLKISETSICTLCNEQCEIINLKENTQIEIKEYFADLCQLTANSLEKIKRIALFQNKLLVKYKIKLNAEIKRKKIEYNQCEEKIFQTVQENQLLKTKLRELKQKRLQLLQKLNHKDVKHLTMPFFNLDRYKRKTEMETNRHIVRSIYGNLKRGLWLSDIIESDVITRSDLDNSSIITKCEPELHERATHSHNLILFKQLTL